MSLQDADGARPGHRIVVALAVLCFGYALYIALRHAGQPPLDQYSFRQTQTALTAYWLARDGFSLAYATPVAGPPWSVPFEFPLYQAIVAYASKVFGAPLDAVGRITSFVFLALTLVPARRATRSLGLPAPVFPVFAALLLSSPLYLYWGRTFMIETAAVFLAVAAIACFVEFRKDTTRAAAGVGFVVFMALAILQKATTGLPVLAVLAMVQGLGWIGTLAVDRRWPAPRHVATVVLAIAVPLAIGLGWTMYTDDIKSTHPMAQVLTSSKLSAWNWGLPKHRLEAPLYQEVLWSRVFVQNLGGWLGLGALVAALVLRGPAIAKRTMLAALAIGLLHLLLFPRLHIIHSYYQSGSGVFFLYALAVAVGGLLPARLPRVPVAALLAIVLVASNLYWFRARMLPSAQEQFTVENSRDLAIGRMLAEALPPDGQFVAFGNDWSSSFAYLSGRKSLNAAPLFPNFTDIMQAPERYVEPGKLGAVVVCPGSRGPGLADMETWARSGRDWRLHSLHGCVVALPATATVPASLRPAEPAPAAGPVPPPTPMPPVAAAETPPGPVVAAEACEGHLDLAAVAADGATLEVQGWTTVSGRDGVLPDRVWISVAAPGGPARFFPASKSSRPDVNQHFGRPNAAPMGFQGVAPLSGFAGEVVVGVVRQVGGRIESCPLQRNVDVPAR